MALRVLFVVFAILCAPAAASGPVRVAVYNVELDRKGPGLLLRDILNGVEDVEAVAQVIRRADPDILLLLRFDYDYGLAALRAFNTRLGEDAFPHLFALRPNTGRVTGLDVDGDGRIGEPEDAQSFGQFAGQNGMALLSRFPIERDAVNDLSGLLWADLPGAQLPVRGNDPFWPPEVLSELRLSTVGHWDVPVRLTTGQTLNLLAWHGSPPIFDGPEDRNGLRAADEVRLWQHYLDGALGPPPTGPVVVLGGSNIDPSRGEGRHGAMLALLADPRLQDPRPTSAGAAAAGDASDTVAWADFVEAGNLRVSYVLPDARLSIRDAGVLWPAPGPQADALLGPTGQTASRHRLVWVDILVPPVASWSP